MFSISIQELPLARHTIGVNNMFSIVHYRNYLWLDTTGVNNMFSISIQGLPLARHTIGVNNMFSMAHYRNYLWLDIQLV